MCSWEQSLNDDFDWLKHNDSDSFEYLGPDTDHTMNNPDGKNFETVYVSPRCFALSVCLSLSPSFSLCPPSPPPLSLSLSLFSLFSLSFVSLEHFSNFSFLFSNHPGIKCLNKNPILSV